MTHEQDDRLSDQDFEDYLEGRSRLTRGYERLKEVEPPAALDRAILDQARAAASPPRRSFWLGWMPRVAAAAVVVLAVAVTLRMDPVPTDRDMLAPSVPAEEDAEAQAMRELPDALSSAPDETLDERPGPELGKAAPEPDRARASSSRPAASETADADAPAAGLVSEPERRAVLLKRLSTPAPGEAEAETSWRNSPEDWLAHVDDLVDAGDVERASAELAAFREAWPDYPLAERYEDLLQGGDGSDAGVPGISEPQ